MATLQPLIGTYIWKPVVTQLLTLLLTLWTTLQPISTLMLLLCVLLLTLFLPQLTPQTILRRRPGIPAMHHLPQSVKRGLSLHIRTIPDLLLALEESVRCERCQVLEGGSAARLAHIGCVGTRDVAGFVGVLARARCFTGEDVTAHCLGCICPKVETLVQKRVWPCLAFENEEVLCVKTLYTG